MNLRALKKREKRAAKTLIRKHGYRPDDFTPSDGTESMYAPKDLDGRFQRHGFVEPGPLKGTPLIWEQVSYEYDEWDARFPSAILEDLEFDWEAAVLRVYGVASLEEVFATDSSVSGHSEIRREA